jgi:putative ABC transport system permease protein
MAFLRSAVAILFRRSRVEGEMDEELRLHIRNRADDLKRSGLEPDAAERQARLDFGGYEHFKEECREVLGAHWLETLIQDTVFALRLLRKSPGFAAVTIVTLALGIGANTAIFSVIYAVLLRPLPYPKPGQLVNVFENNLQRGVPIAGFSYPDLTDLQASGIFARVGGVERHNLTLTGSGEPTVVATVVVTREVFSALDVRPLAGRYLLSEDHDKGSAPVVVLSEGLWRARFAANPDILGKPITLDQLPFTVVGIMPAGFRVPLFGDHQEIWIPVVHDPLFSGFMPGRGGHWLRVVGRLRPGVSLARAQSEADSLIRTLAGQFPEDSGWAWRLAPLQSAIVEDIRTPLLVVLAAVGLVLLLACVNIANLLLARATSRTREVALRQALGAPRSRIVRQLLTESTVLGLLGATCGMVLAYLSVHALAMLLPQSLPTMHDVEVDGWMLGFALVLSLAASMAFGLAPALLAAGSNVHASLKEGGRASGSGSGRLRARRFLAAAEIGLATILMVSAGLLVRSLIAMTSVDPGFNTAHILKAQVSLPQYRYTKHEQWAAFVDTLLDRIHTLPGFQDTAAAVPLPVADGFVPLKVSIPDQAPPPPGAPRSADYVSVSPGYFRVLGIPLVRGRLFTREDSASAPPTTIVSEAFSRLYFHDEDPIGKRITFGFPLDGERTREIVGVVGDVRDEELREAPKPMMYVPFAQAPFWGTNLVVKSTAAPSIVVSEIREVVRSIDKDLPVTDIATMPEALDASLTQPKFRTWLLSGFGVVALLLAAAGVFGVVSYSALSRTREFGVRAALGATPSTIGRMIVKEGLTLGALGLGVGLAGALGFARFLKSELYGVAVYDPVTFSVSAGFLLAVTVVACYVPARRAMRVDPMIALRCE